MTDSPLHVVTGAFGYFGSCIGSRLIASGVRVPTITNSLRRPSALQGRIEAHSLNFDHPERLVDSLRGASVLYNTYRVRFNAAEFHHSVTVENSLIPYRLQPIFVDDLASLAVAQGSSHENVVVNAIGAETFTYRSLVETIGQAIGRVRPIVLIPPSLAYGVGWARGHLLGDVIITRPEIEGLMADLLYVDAAPTGTTRPSTWARTHSSTLGIRYSNEMARRRNRQSEYRPAA